MPLENMGFVGGYLNTGESLANTENTKSLIAEREILNKARLFQLEQAGATRRAMMAAATPDEPSSMASLTPESLAASEGSDQPGSPGAGSSSQVTAPGEPPKLSLLHRAEYEREQRAAKKIAEFGGDPKQQETHLKNAEMAIAKATAAEKEERQAEVEKWTNLRNLVSSAVDEESLNNTVIPNAIAQYGKKAVDQLIKSSGLEVDPTTGRLPWSEKNKNAIESIANMATTQEQRVRRQDRQEDRDRKIQALEEKKQHDRETEQHQRNMESIAREGIETRREFAADRAERERQRTTDRVTKDAQRSLERDPIYRDFGKYEMGIDQARQIADDLAKGKTKVLDAPTARALVTQFQNISEGYRSRAGGKYALQDAERFNGLMQKLNKWWESIGQATPTLDVTTARDVANTIVGLGDIANKNVVISSLDAMERVARKGGDPDDIRMRGNLKRLVALGQAKQETNGKTVTITIGDRQFKFKRDEEE